MTTRRTSGGESPTPTPPHVLVDGRRCVALVLRGGRERDGSSLFADWLRRNADNSAAACLEYRGCVPPSTLLLSGTPSALEGVRSAWAHRLLRPPRGYAIDRLGDVVGTLAMTATHREDALCGAPGGFVRERRTRLRTTDEDDGYSFVVCTPMPREEVSKIQNHLAESTPHHQAPSSDPSVLRTAERRSPRTVGERSSSPPSEGSRTGRGSRGGDWTDGDIHGTGEKRQRSVLAKILKRMNLLTDRSTTKHVLFSAQFPPPNARVCCHSVGKRPAIKLLESTGSKISWEEIPNNFGLGVDPPHCVGLNLSHKKLHSELDGGSNPRKNPSLLAGRADWQRYSHHGTFPKRRHKSRFSSQNSPKVQRNILNKCNHQSAIGSRSDSRDKVCRSSSSGPTFIEPNTWNPKELDLMQADSHSSKDKCIQPPAGNLGHEVSKLAKNNLKTKIDNISDTFDDQQINTSKKDELLQTATGQTSSSEKSVSCNCSVEPSKPEIPIQPLILKRLVDIPTPKPSETTPNEILIDNSVSVEVPLDKSFKKSKTNDVLSTTIVTEETTVVKANGNSKVVTVTSITTSLSQGGFKTSDDPDCLLELAASGDP